MPIRRKIMGGAADLAYFYPRDGEEASEFLIQASNGSLLNKHGGWENPFTESLDIFFKDLESVERVLIAHSISCELEVHEVVRKEGEVLTLQRMRRVKPREYYEISK
jgi:hypothetical protein